MPDGVLRVDIGMIDQSVPETISRGQSKASRPTSSPLTVTRSDVWGVLSLSSLGEGTGEDAGGVFSALAS
jgi:hypothetical protein